MPDFQPFNPDKNLRAHAAGLPKGKARSNGAADNEQAASASMDPYADLKMDPNEMMRLLSAQGQANRPLSIGVSGLEGNMQVFSASVTPERHQQVSDLLSKIYLQEFGKPPSAGLLQDMIDNFLVGQPSITSPA